MENDHINIALVASPSEKTVKLGEKSFQTDVHDILLAELMHWKENLKLLASQQLPLKEFKQYLVTRMGTLEQALVTCQATQIHTRKQNMPNYWQKNYSDLLEMVFDLIALVELSSYPRNPHSGDQSDE